MIHANLESHIPSLIITVIINVRVYFQRRRLCMSLNTKTGPVALAAAASRWLLCLSVRPSVRNGNQNCDDINSRNGDSLLQIASSREVVSILIVGLSCGARNVLSYTRHMVQNFLAFGDSPIISLGRSPKEIGAMHG